MNNNVLFITAFLAMSFMLMMGAFEINDLKKELEDCKNKPTIMEMTKDQLKGIFK